MSKLRAPTQKELDHALETRKIEAGAFGKFFGVGEQASKAITGSLIVLLCLLGTMLSVLKPWVEAAEYWKWAGPIITLCLGYLFGNKESK